MRNKHPSIWRRSTVYRLVHRPSGWMWTLLLVCGIPCTQSALDAMTCPTLWQSSERWLHYTLRKLPLTKNKENKFLLTIVNFLVLFSSSHSFYGSCEMKPRDTWHTLITILCEEWLTIAIYGFLHGLNRSSILGAHVSWRSPQSRYQNF